MYQLTDNSTGKSEMLTEQEAITKYGADKVNEMMFGLDPDMSLNDTTGDTTGDTTEDDFDFAY